MVKLFLGYLQVMGQVVYSLVEEVVVDSNIQDRTLSIHLLQEEVVVAAVVAVVLHIMGNQIQELVVAVVTLLAEMVEMVSSLFVMKLHHNLMS
jgi:hypothetical protein